MRMVALNSTTPLSMGILVYSARRFGYSTLTPTCKESVFYLSAPPHVFVCVATRGPSRFDAAVTY